MRDDSEVEHVMCHTGCNTRLLVLLDYLIFILYCSDLVGAVLHGIYCTECKPVARSLLNYVSTRMC